jgi:hypothetical protein
MATPYFEEVQRLRDNRWIFVLIFAVALGSLIPLLYGMYWQIGQGIPWGNEPMKDQELIIFTIFIFVTVALLTFMIANLRLETRIDAEGIHYRMVPIKSRWRIVTPQEIEEYTFADKYKAFESGRVGHHRNIFKNMRSFRISGGKHITLKHKNGFRLLLGTQDQAGMEWAMRKLMHKTNA